MHASRIPGNRRKPRLLIRVVGLVATVVTAALGVSAVVSIYLSSAALEQSLVTRAQVQCSTAAQILATPMFLGDGDEAAIISGNLAAADSSIRGLELSGVDDEAPWLGTEPWRSLMSGREKTGAAASDGLIGWRRVDGRLAVLAEVRYEDQIVGHIGLTAGLDQLPLLRNRVLRTTILIGLGILAVSVLAAAVFIRRTVERPLLLTMDVIDGMAAGDLTHRMLSESDDEIGSMGRALDKALDQVGTTIRTIADNSRELAAASSRLNAASSSMCAGAEDSSSQAAVIASAVADIAADAGRVADVVQTAFDLTDSTGRAFEDLLAQSKQIGGVVDIIASIALQTNMLALNAAIEAARAGDAGRGFSVVAEEVNALSARTGAATNQISTTIATIQQGVCGANTAVQRLREVIGEIRDIQAGITLSINAGDGTRPSVSAGVESLATSARSVDENARVTLQSSESLSGMADRLSDLIGQFHY